MRLVVDLQSAQSGSRLGGIGRYSLDLLRGMLKTAGGHEIQIVLNGQFEREANEVRDLLRNEVPASNFHVFQVPREISYFDGNIELLRSATVLREQFIESLNPDAVHLTSLFEGLHENVSTSINSTSSRIPVAVTLYDLIPLKQRSLYLRNFVVRRHYFSKFRQLRDASALLAISQYSADEALEELGAFNGIVQDIKSGIDPKFRPVPDALDLLQASEAFRAITGAFILYTASFDVRKNQAGLIRAYAKLPAEIQAGYQLVLVGGADNAVYERLAEYARALGIAPDRVVFTGRVSDEDLIVLYNTCALFVFPSLWEGLGMPVLEALACGAPVISSNTTSLPEVLGTEIGLFDPNNDGDIAARMEQGLVDPAFRASLRAHVDRHLTEFTWERSGERAWRAIETACKSARQALPAAAPVAAATGETVGQALARHCQLDELSDGELRMIASCATTNEATVQALTQPPSGPVGWVTTWGTRCGIASYSRKFIAHSAYRPIIFAPHADAPETIPGYDVRRCWTQGKIPSLAELAREVIASGVESLVIQVNYGLFDFGAFNDLVDTLYAANIKVFLTLHSTVDQSDDERQQLSYIRRALAAASGLFVHSRHDVEQLAKLGLSANVTLISDGVDPALVKTPAVQPMRRRIATYGFALPGKGLEQMVEAVAILRAQGEPVTLAMHNADYGDTGGVSRALLQDIGELIAARGLADCVSLHPDYVPDADSITRLQQADLIVFPYQRTGESSSAAVRMGLAAQRPVAVTPLPIFSDVREGTYALPGRDAEAIATGVAEIFGLIEGRAPLAGEKARAAARWLAVNDLRQVTAVMDRAIARAALGEHWQTVYAAALPELPMQEGFLKNGRIVSGQRDGTLCHGPYLDLMPGLYRFSMRANVSQATPKSLMRLRFSSNAGQETQQEYAISYMREESVFVKTIFVPVPTRSVEVVILSEGGARVEVIGYELERRRPH
ncbi:glycosyltransferase [Azorhizobium doebereinerae]|uniref:glycosyltransferase n=1 Tax=Azorhizobium doebereinerae TaxID=281091 RepID=UPI0018DE3547|nr:glycosyltransferase [Azorhizobium doebereinerae]